jgi:hypothetical protein
MQETILKNGRQYPSHPVCEKSRISKSLPYQPIEIFSTNMVLCIMRVRTIYGTSISNPRYLDLHELYQYVPSAKKFLKNYLKKFFLIINKKIVLIFF